MLRPMKYQLVLQFEAASIADFDQFIALEDLLTATLSRKCRVDGHDCGEGEFNIFIFTDDPKGAFEEASKVLQDHTQTSGYKAAYREMTSDGYVIVWPPTLDRFTIT